MYKHNLDLEKNYPSDLKNAKLMQMIYSRGIKCKGIAAAPNNFCGFVLFPNQSRRNASKIGNRYNNFRVS